jgi:uncharacterized protein YqjF (DUF2071 family)
VPLPVVCQRWSRMTFLHWAYEPDVVAHLLPRGLVPDVFDGRAWVAVTPFVLQGMRLSLTPPLPGLSSFSETNVRTYVKGPDGRDGLFFISLEVASLATMIGARLGYGVPYRWAAMAVGEEDGTVVYTSRRRTGSPAGHRIVVRPGSPYHPGELGERDHWLTGRWRAWSCWAGRFVSIPVRHEPWPLWRAEVLTLEETLLADAGLPVPGAPPLVHYSPGVDDVRLGPPVPVGSRPWGLSRRARGRARA